MIKGKTINRPLPKEADYVRTVKEIVDAVNSIAPDAPYFDWFAGHPEAKAAVHFRNGEYAPELSADQALHGGEVSGAEAENIRVHACDGKTGGVFLEGPGRCEVNGAAIMVSGDSTGIGGPATGAAVKGGGELILRDAFIDAFGLTHYATVAERNSVLRVYDSVIASHGAPFGEGQPQPTGIMQTPPPGLMIDGNGRTHCTMTGSHSYFDRCLITCDGWGALSTETAEGYAYLEANDCNVITVRRGYGAYADPGCHVVLNNCSIDSADMAGIIGGQGEMILCDCETVCGSMGLLFHSVAGVPEEIGELEVSGGSLFSKGPTALIRSDNARLYFEDAELHSDEGVLIRSQVNDDPLATPAGENPVGIEVCFSAMDAEGDILHEDTERPMFVYFHGTTLTGVIKGAHIEFDLGSKWFATSDSEVILMGEAHEFQFDAPENVTILLHCAGSGSVKLPSGGTLEMVD